MDTEQFAQLLETIDNCQPDKEVMDIRM